MSVPQLKGSLPENASVPRTGIVLTGDGQLRTFARDPKERFVPDVENTAMASTSLEEICDGAERSHSRILTFFHDHFFGGGERELHLAHPEFIDCTRRISEYAESRGMGIGASVTNPLDLGRNFREILGVGGQHRFFAEGTREPDGSFRLDVPMPARWTNNKGHIYPVFRLARLFAYTEEDDGSPYLTIDPAGIREIPERAWTCAVSEEPYALSRWFGNRHMVASGRTDLPGNRVFAVLHMDTPEMDYFHPGVTDYVHGVIDRYLEEGVEFMELYSDEMHIQFDWDFTHFGPHELPTRYMTDHFQKALEAEDPIFADFDKALIYMGYDMTVDRETLGRAGTQHVLGRSPADLYRTFLLRRTYYEALQDRVVEICCEARDYVRATYRKHAGWDPLCLGHATWQESPTCDMYGPDSLFYTATQRGFCAYDYSPDYVYSSTIRECISGCYDYFKWNDYFSYGGNDFCECGWFDRNYYGGAMAASLGALNRNEAASWGAWGFPDEARRRFNSVCIGFGALRAPREEILTWGRPRTVDVLYVYPKDLTAVEERFGSWMVQYGYANYAPADRLVRLGRVRGGTIRLGIATYTTVVVGFEPFYRPELLTMLGTFARGGGRVVWNSAPPAARNGRVPSRFLSLFGLSSVQSLTEGGCAHEVRFSGSLASLKPMRVPTDMLPDRIYRVSPAPGTEAVANAGYAVIGARRRVGKGEAVYLGCRLRDDQTGESGDGPSTLFDLLKLLGAYGGADVRDNTETISRRTPYFATKFPNGTCSVCRHYYPMRELWEGGFGRDAEKDRKVLENYPYMVPTRIELSDFAIEGHAVTYGGEGVLQYRLDAKGRLAGFRGDGSDGVTIDGRTFRVTAEPASTSFGPIEPCRLPDGYRAGWLVYSTAPEVDLCRPIPANAELYIYAAMGGAEAEGLVPDASLALDGSVVRKGHVPAVAILVRK